MAEPGLSWPRAFLCGGLPAYMGLSACAGAVGPVRGPSGSVPPTAARPARALRSEARLPGLSPVPASIPAAAAQSRQGPRSGLLGVGNLEVALGKFFDVDVLERHNPNILHETGRPVHVPNPCVLHGDFKEDLAVLGCANVQLDLVGEVEPALGLDHMGEQPHDVPVLAIELQLHLGLVLLEILRAHGLPSDPATT